MENSGSRNLELKHLGFVRIALIQSISCITNLYVYVKQNSGSLRSAVETVEIAVKTVVSPAYEKLRIATDDVLVFLDEKVGKATKEFDKRAPPVAKQAVQITHRLVQKAARAARKFLNEYRTGGLSSAFQSARKDGKQLILHLCIMKISALNRLPLFQNFVDMAMPSAVELLEKYNWKGKDIRQKAYYVFAFFLEVPLSEVATAFEQGEAKNKEETSPRTPVQALPAH